MITSSYVPAAADDKSSKTEPLDQLKVYGGTEPVVVWSIKPSKEPKQLILNPL